MTVRAPLPHLRLMPTGGVTVDNIRSYLDVGAFGAGVGSALVNNTIVANKDWNSLIQRAQAFVEKL